MVAQVGELCNHGLKLRSRRILTTADAGFAEQRQRKRPHGNEIAASPRAVHRAGAVVAIKYQRRQPLRAVHIVHGPVGNHLILQVLVILAVLVGNGPHLFRRLFGQIAVRRRIGENNLLPRIDAGFALQQDQVLLISVLSVKQRLLLSL